MESKIHGVFVAPRKKIEDDRGAVFHVMRSDAPEFVGFGETYVSTVRGRTIKAWKKHKAMAQSITVPVGGVLFVLYDDRADSPSRGQIDSIEMDSNSYGMIRIPPNIWYGFRGLSRDTTILINCASLPHDPDEVERLPLDSPMIPYQWTPDPNP